ncbi:peroxidase-related enzyme [Deinococcus pimensis]|uniref:peroxidase-related enzyme n=1 Tax=Deinococcus pimensis TaxID=309888 RepID=UPI000482EC63|nr:peroxidase-related enzyme [Deinococcus pimensis]
MSDTLTDERISYLRVPDREELPEDARALQDAGREKFGFVPNVVRGWAVRPEHLVKWRAHYDLVMLGDSKLSRVQRELIAVAVSSVNRCEYCSTTHPAFLRVALQEEGRDPHVAHAVQSNPYHAVHDERLTPMERAILSFALRVTTSSHEIGPAEVEFLRASGLDDETIFDVAQVAAMFNFTNRLANATGLKPNPEYHDMGR